MYVNLGMENGGFPINVSEGGMAFHGVRPMRKDQILQIKFRLPGQVNSVESAAQIAWLNDLGKGGGLQFVDLPETSQRLIKEWLALQTPTHSLAEKIPVALKPVEARVSKPASATKPETGRDRSSRKIYSSAAREPLHSPSIPVEASKIIPAATLAGVHGRPIEIAKIPGFRDPQLKSPSRGLWSVSFPFALVTSLGLATFLGLAAYQFHWTFEIPETIPNPVALFGESATGTPPQFISELQPAAAPKNLPAASAPAVSSDPAPAMDSRGASEASAIPEPLAPASRPAKKVVPLKMKPPRIASRHAATIAGRVPPGPVEKSATSDAAPPLIVPTAKPELAAQLPALPTEIPPPAPAPREPVVQSSTFEAAQIVSKKRPVYPAAVRASGFYGSVELHFIISADGSVRDVTVVKGNLLLARAATEAVQAWRYKPARRDGVPVDSESSMTFVFDSN